MDDYFSGLIAPHINEMRLEEENPPGNNQERQERNNKKTREVSPVVTKVTNTADKEPTRELTPPVDRNSEEDTKNDDTIRYTTQSTSTTSSTSSTSSRSSTQYISLRDYQPPNINYQRDTPLQLLVAIIGREFDEPQAIVKKLHPLVPLSSDSAPLLKLIPFTVRRSVLVKANFDWQELKELDLVCMCYNASEARILLTGQDGFYTQLIKRLESVLGSNKIAFLITNYMSEIDSTPSLIDTNLRTRLSAQTGLTTYLETNQVLSWFQEPSKSHVTKLIELAHSEPNPSNFCVVL